MVDISRQRKPSVDPKISPPEYSLREVFEEDDMSRAEWLAASEEAITPWTPDPLDDA